MNFALPGDLIVMIRSPAAGIQLFQVAAQLGQGDVLNLANAFSGHLEFLADCLQRPRPSPIYPETQGEDFRLTRSQVLDVLADFLAHRFYAKQFVRGQRRFVFDDVAEPIVVIIPDRRIEAGGTHAQRAELSDLVGRHVASVG